MKMLRSERQAALAELHAQAEELTQRYEAAASLENLPDALRGRLRRITAERRLLTAALAELEQGREDLPEAADPDRTTLQEAVDRLSRVVGEEALAERLRGADLKCLAEAERASQLDWSADEAAVLERLVRHLQESLRTLEAV